MAAMAGQLVLDLGWIGGQQRQQVGQARELLGGRGLDIQQLAQLGLVRGRISTGERRGGECGGDLEDAGPEVVQPGLLL
jgi:hypothetical protein